VALTEKYIGGIYENADQLNAAAQHHGRALRFDEQRRAANPADRVAAFDVAIDLSNLGHIEQGRGRYPAAADFYLRSLAIRERLAASDPQDALARSKVAFVHRQLGFLGTASGDRDAAVAHFRRAAEIYGTLDPGGLDTRRNLAAALAQLGELERDRAVGCRAANRGFVLYSTLSQEERLIISSPDPLLAAARTAAGCGSPQAQSWLRAHPPPRG
jgi:tetratricopeptide (TPR) repeat protein